MKWESKVEGLRSSGWGEELLGRDFGVWGGKGLLRVFLGIRSLVGCWWFG